jgi:hypothetical protein
MKKKAVKKTGFRGPSPDVGKATQFQPGNRANPGGRPKTAILSQTARERLADVDPQDSAGRTYAMIIVDAQIEEAVKGDLDAAAWLADRAEGRAVQSVQMHATIKTSPEEQADLILQALRDLPATYGQLSTEPN